MSIQPYKIAILAMGGEGGGVLADWIVQLGEANGFVAQTTSVPGVAQRTGATIYYVELFEKKLSDSDSQLPVLSLMPMPGDVDIVLASELMEAGRAVVRGLVTSNRTTLIASTHRVYAFSEKSHMGDGRIDSGQLLENIKKVSNRFIGFDMEKVAQDHQSVISAVLFGALASSKILPFTKSQFEETVRQGGVGVAQSLKAFDTAYFLSESPTDAEVSKPLMNQIDSFKLPSQSGLHPKIKSLIKRLENAFPTNVQEILLHGARRLVEYQDPDYAHLFLDRMLALKNTFTSNESELIRESARHLALWMSYEDTVRVASLKIQASRFDRVRQETHATVDQLVLINEYMHPRVQEIAETLPSILGRMILGSKILRYALEALTSKGRVVQTSTIGGFLVLTLVASAKRWRRSTLRFKAEDARIEKWMALIKLLAAQNSEKTLEWIKCQTLVKGYSETHERGVKNFELIYEFVQKNVDTLHTDIKALRLAALADEKGIALQAALTKI